jgi:glycosyltransferase involved in cell wall biosynthesis
LKILLFANTDWYLYNFRRSLALALHHAGHDVLLTSPPGPYGQKLADLGLRWLPAPMERRSLNPIKEAALVLWLARLVQAERVDLVHGFTIKCAVYGALAARLKGVARVSAVAGMGYVFSSDDLKARLLRPLVRGVMRMALGGAKARLILQNPDDVALFEQAAIVSAAQVHLIAGSGVDCKRFAARTEDWAQPSSGRFRVVLPARLLWDKGVAEYIDAARVLRSQGLTIDLLLAGEPDPGNPAAVPLALLQSWVDEGLVQWLGHVDDMPGLFGSVDAVVLPSYREGLPKGLIEAGASGLPLITTDVPGCREVVTHEVDGLLVPAKDAVALAEAIARLHADAALCKRLGQAARAKALAEFDEQLVIKRTIDVYRALCPGQFGQA